MWVDFSEKTITTKVNMPIATPRVLFQTKMYTQIVLLIGDFDVMCVHIYIWLVTVCRIDKLHKNLPTE